jgi:Adenylate and Guanylate cyclase catalytic domain
MESTGAKNKIHASSETAKRLMRAGKSHWVTPREEEVEIKGKGNMQTYWISLDKKTSRNESHTTSESSGSENASVHQWDANDHEYEDPGTMHRNLSPDMYRLVQWNSDILTGILKQIVAYRQAAGVIPDAEVELLHREFGTESQYDGPRKEMVEVVHLPSYDNRVAAKQTDPESIKLDDAVTNELFSFVTAIAAMYNGKRRLFWCA